MFEWVFFLSDKILLLRLPSLVRLDCKRCRNWSNWTWAFFCGISVAPSDVCIRVIGSKCHTFECVHQAIAHDMPELSVTNLRCNDQMLLRRCHYNGTNQTGACHRHCPNLEMKETQTHSGWKRDTSLVIVKKERFYFTCDGNGYGSHPVSGTSSGTEVIPSHLNKCWRDV